MPKLFDYLKIDFYKYYHSKVIIIHLIFPLIAILTFLWYNSISSYSEIAIVSFYIQTISSAFPMVIAIIVNMIYEQESLSNFQYMLFIPNKKYFAHFSKLISLLILGLISSLITILGFGIIFYLSGNKSLEIYFYIKESLIVFISNIPLYMLQYLVVFSFGNGTSLGFGILGSLLAALMATGIGDGIWTVLPWSYSIRLGGYYLLNSINIIIPKGEIIQSTILILIFIIIFLVLQVIFSNYWEGKKEN